ncbi:MAG: hypothetical protein M0R73_06430 [Dehalococcoidia bacterium]|nr:hypothetical protein [Dehalococcoidia bacterium]
MASFTFEQLFRTTQSEQWKVLDAAGATAGRVDVHFEPGVARVSVVVQDDVNEDDLQDLLSTIDERLVPQKARADVKITAWRGAALGTFAPDRG